MSNIKEKIEKAKAKARRATIGLATTLTVASSGFNANAGNFKSQVSQEDKYGIMNDMADFENEISDWYNTSSRRTVSQDHNQGAQEFFDRGVQQSEDLVPQINEMPKAGSEPSDLKDTVKELQAKGYSNKDIIAGLDAFVKRYTVNDPNFDIWSMFKTTKEAFCFGDINARALAILKYGKSSAKENWSKEIIDVAKSISSELKMNEGIDARQVSQSRQQEQSRQVQQSSQTQQSDVQLKSLPEKYGVYNLAYGEKDGSIVCEFNMSNNSVEYIFPPTLRTKDGIYSIGTAIGFDQNMAREDAELEMKKIVAHQVIAADIQAQVKESGRQLTEAESNFLAYHQKDLKDWSLVVMKDGTICQTQGKYNAGHALTIDGNTTKVVPPTMSNSYSR